MEPVGTLSDSGEIVVVQHCWRGRLRGNRSAADDDRDALLAPFGRPVPDPS
jgi:hypothetical protein